MEDSERGVGPVSVGTQHGQGPRSHGHRVAGGDRCGPLPPGVGEDEQVVVEQRPLALVQVGCGRARHRQPASACRGTVPGWPAGRGTAAPAGRRWPGRRWGLPPRSSPGPVVVGPVPVGLAVGLVVPGVIRDEIAQGEAVAAGDEVDRGGPTARPAVQVGGAGDAGRDLAVLAAPEVPHRVAVLAVPLAPLRREAADVVAVGLADVPQACRVREVKAVARAGGVEAVVPGDPADDRLGVGVQQQLGRVAARSARGVVGAVHPVAVPPPGPDIGYEPVPHARVVLRQRQLCLPAVGVEQAQDDRVGDLGGNRKPGAARRWRRPERERRPRPHLGHRFHPTPATEATVQR